MVGTRTHRVDGRCRVAHVQMRAHTSPSLLHAHTQRQSQDLDGEHARHSIPAAASDDNNIEHHDGHSYHRHYSSRARSRLLRWNRSLDPQFRRVERERSTSCARVRSPRIRTLLTASILSWSHRCRDSVHRVDRRLAAWDENRPNDFDGSQFRRVTALNLTKTDT